MGFFYLIGVFFPILLNIMDPKRKILIVDDEKNILQLLKDNLKVEFDVYLADCGVAALRLFEQNYFDLMIADVRMPGIDGLQLLRSVKNQYGNCVVLLMTGFAETQVAVNALNEGAFAFVTKPLEMGLLLKRIHYAVAVIQNRENQEKVLKEMKSELLMQSLFAQRLSALAALSGGISHEMLQPLSGIKIYLATLQDKVREDNQIESNYLLETLEKILKQVNRATKIIEHMREFAIEGNRNEIMTLTLKEAIERSLELFKVQIRARGIELKLDIPAGLIIHVNPNRFEQVLVNLIANAKDSIIEKSSKKNMEGFKKYIFIQGREDKDWTILDVADSGLGVPEGIQKTLFEPFVTSKKNSMGSGLGLAICKRILLDYNANIELLRSSSEESAFRIRFPKI